MDHRKKIPGIAFFVMLIIFNFTQLAIGDENTNNQLRFYTDFAGFQSADTDQKTYQEIYISFANYQLTYRPNDDKFLAGYQITVLINDSSGAHIDEKNWKNFSQVDSLNHVEDLTTLELAGFLLQPGTYSVEIVLQDMESKAVGSAEKPMVVTSFDREGVELAGIEFARSVKRSEEKNQFTKNSVEVIPNPSRVFGIESPFVYFYTEMYNIAVDSRGGGQVVKEFYLNDTEGNALKSSRKEVKTKKSSAVWVDKINILDLVSGKYLLQLKVADIKSGKSVERQGEFWIHNPFITISLAQYREEDIDEFRAQIIYLIEQKELDMFDQLNVPAKIKYINDYWRGKDPNFRTEHLKRFYAVQERFASPSLPGWKSDRGRVYIMYGPPDEIEREPAGMDTRAYEVWIYETLEQQGRIHFVFCDFGVFGNYRLIHSNIESSRRSEIYNPDWINDIRIAR